MSFVMEPPVLSIVFLNYNRLSQTTVTLNKLLTCREHKTGIEIVAVDNGSDDGTREFLTRYKDEIKTVFLDKNIGIAAYNRGFRIAAGEILIVLDDDSHIEAGTIDRVMDIFGSSPDVGVVAFKITDREGKRFNTWHLPSSDRFQESFAFVGCGFAIRKTVFENAGYYPEDFFLYHNEIYVAVKVKLDGFRVVYDPGCVAVHRTEGQPRNPERRIYYTLRNSLLLIWMYYPVWSALYLTLSRVIISSALAVFNGKMGILFKGIADFISSPPARNVLPRDKRCLLKPFFCHNSIIHRVLISE